MIRKPARFPWRPTLLSRQYRLLFRCCVYLTVALSASSRLLAQPTGSLGLFSDHADMGVILHPGSTAFDPAHNSYTVTGSGDNTWFKSDDLHFVWKRIDSGDVSLSAGIQFPSSGGNAHRKAMLMIRQSLDPDSAYVDVARHGDGLTSLQYRDTKGDITREIETALSGPPSLRLVKRGDFFYVLYSAADGVWHFTGASMKLSMHGAIYVGLAVCSHDKDVIEKAEFSRVELSSESSASAGDGMLVSTLETVPVASGDRRVVYTAAAHFEAPNWLRDNSGFLINQNGRLQRVEAKPAGGEPGAGPRMRWNGSQPVELNSSAQTKLNNDHGLSPDGGRIAFSDSTEPGGSRVYIMPVAGEEPRKITVDAPSYFHGWSPDGKLLAFTGERNGQFDIYTIPAEGGGSTQLTKSAGFNDGPDYSADGSWIYFNSTRSGHMQIWRMHPDGSSPEQVTHDATEDWFAHPSPDGKWIVFLSYPPGTKGHPGSQDVTLQVMPAAGGESHQLARIWGGQGTINVPSWSPDSTKIAFISYAMLPADAAR
jgi:TolB protein